MLSILTGIEEFFSSPFVYIWLKMCTFITKFNQQFISFSHESVPCGSEGKLNSFKLNRDWKLFPIWGTVWRNDDIPSPNPWPNCCGEGSILENPFQKSPTAVAAKIKGYHYTTIIMKWTVK